MLNYAEMYYDAGNYEEMAKIYMNENLSENVIALTNLGYMYAHGIFFEKNIDSAEWYYNKAIKLGYEQAYNNKVAMYLNCHHEKLREVFREGLEGNHQSAADYIAGFLNLSDEQNNPLSRMKCLEFFCNELDDEMQTYYINKVCYGDWKEPIYVQSSGIPKDTYMEKYVLVSDKESLRGYTTHIYEKYARIVNRIEVFGEGLVFKEDIN